MADSKQKNRYIQIIEKIFLSRYRTGTRKVSFEREDIVQVARDLRIVLPKNLGDILYSFRYRSDLPESVRKCAPKGEEWIIMPVGRSRYSFVSTKLALIAPSPGLVETKIPDSTPGIIEKYAFTDEQALLAKLRYNRLVDVFTGVTCCSLQNHLRTTVPDMGQVETDEIYVGIDRRGVHYVFPVQAKGGKDKLSIIQIIQDFGVCVNKFPQLVCRPIAAQFMEDDLISLFEFEQTQEGPAITSEKHYRLVPPDDISPDELTAYQQRPF